MADREQFSFGCSHCQQAESCPLAETMAKAGSAENEHRGARLVLPALVVFIMPLLTGITGAYLAAHWWAQDNFASVGGWQTAGLFGGLIAGILLAKIMLWLAGYNKGKSGESKE
jgi:MFS family permease